MTSNQQLLQRVLVALNLAMSGFRAHEGRYGDGETTVAGKRAQAVINDLIPLVEAASLPVETACRISKAHAKRILQDWIEDDAHAESLRHWPDLRAAYEALHAIAESSSVEPSRDDTEDMANIGRALMARLPKDYHWSDCPTEIVTDLQNEIHDLRRADYEEVLADHRRLVRELDVLLNGEHGAAKQASLCDIVGQLRTRAPSREVFDRYPVGTLFQKKSDGRVLAMTPDSSDTVIAIQPEKASDD